MSPRTLRRLLGGYAIVLFVSCLIVRTTFALSSPKASDIVIVESWWKNGVRVHRAVGESDARAALPPSAREATKSEERVTGEAPILMHPLVFQLSLVPGRDGVRASLDGKTAFATADDLTSAQAYDKSTVYPDSGFGFGTHRATVLAILAEQLGVTTQVLEQRATFTRVRFERVPPKKTPNTTRPAHITEKDLNRQLVTDSLREAAMHLARNVDDRGRYRYLIEATSNKTLGGYNWPRHSGSTFFLAQAAAILDDPFIRYACLRAASRLRDQMTRACGAQQCITEEEAEIAEIGSSALAIIAYTEIVRTKADESYRYEIAKLTSFLRSQQRPDGELMHQIDRKSGKPIDVQFLYFSGEATLALARAHAITNDPRDLDAAKRGLAHISGSGWTFFGSRYYYSEEHWTCQAVAELWERAPNHDALDFCSRWHEYQRRLQVDEGEMPYDVDGAFGFGPLVVPRVTPAASRGEASGALLHVLVREQQANRLEREKERVLVEHELGRSLAFVLRNQFLEPSTPSYLFADPVAVRGAVPGSPVDWVLRIDYAQHAGSMMARWLEVDDLVHHAPKR